MEPAVRMSIFRAYGENRLPSTRAERMAAVVERWLREGTYVLTAGPAEPVSVPTNVVPPDQAIAHQRACMEVHAPLYLWCYPLEVQVQLWRGGWDVRVAAPLLEGAAYRHHDRRNQLRRLLQELVTSLPPLFLVGPARKPPTYAGHALREFERWTTLYIGPTWYRRFNWEPLLEARRARMTSLNGGLWVDVPKHIEKEDYFVMTEERVT
jgi:hypothetical protein